MQYNRKIIHIDMDCFYAAVECLDNPALLGVPVIVGHDSERGVVSTASYEARRYGVHSAQSIRMAKRLCSDLHIVEPHFERYKEISDAIHKIFQRYTDLIEPISLDEAFFTVKQLRGQSLTTLTRLFGKRGQQFYNYARGIDDSPIEVRNVRKSMSCENTFMQDLSIRSNVIIELYHITIELVNRLSESGFVGHTLTLKVKYADFTQVTRSVTHTTPLLTKHEILPLAKKLLAKIEFNALHPIRLMGLGVSSGDEKSKEEKEPKIHYEEPMLPFT